MQRRGNPILMTKKNDWTLTFSHSKLIITHRRLLFTVSRLQIAVYKLQITGCILLFAPAFWCGFECETQSGIESGTESGTQHEIEWLPRYKPADCSLQFIYRSKNVNFNSWKLCKLGNKNCIWNKIWIWIWNPIWNWIWNGILKLEMNSYRNLIWNWTWN